MDEDVWQVILFVVLLALSAFFSASETALMSLSKIRLRNMVYENVKRAQLIQRLLENPGRLLSAILVGNNMVNIGASALATALAIKYFGNKGVGIATGITTLLVLLFAEITPKSLAARNSERISLKVVILLSFFVDTLKPVTTVLMYITNAMIRVLGGKSERAQPYITEDELKTMISVGHEEGVLAGEEKKMIHNVFAFGDARVTDVMTPRIHLVAAELHSSYEKIMDLFRKQQFSRIPVYEDRIDNIVGLLYLKDLFFFDPAEEAFAIKNYMREPYFTFEFKLVSQLFGEMRDKRIQMAVVLDEYGGTAGIITIEDLIEEIVGDIYDEYDKKYNEIEVVKEDEYIVHGHAKIDLINEMIGVNIESEDFDSIGGFITGLFGKLPKAGDSIKYDNIKFVVESANKYRIEKLRMLT